MRFKEIHKTLDIREQQHFVHSLNGKRSGITSATVDKKYTIEVEFTSTPCNFGGRRYWFVCQMCGENRLVLRLSKGRLICNSCTPAPFKSASVSKKDRAAIKRKQILKKLGYDASYDLMVLSGHFKPKGMWQKTYDRLRSEYHNLLKSDAQQLNAICAAAGHDPFYDGDDLETLTQ